MFQNRIFFRLNLVIHPYELTSHAGLWKLKLIYF